MAGHPPFRGPQPGEGLGFTRREARLRTLRAAVAATQRRRLGFTLIEEPASSTVLEKVSLLKDTHAPSDIVGIMLRSQGGTGVSASSPSDMHTKIGLAIGSDVQAELACLVGTAAGVLVKISASGAPNDLFNIHSAASASSLRVDDVSGNVGIGAAPTTGTWGDALYVYGQGLQVARVDPINGEPVIKVAVAGTIPSTVTAFQANASSDTLELVLQQNGAGDARSTLRVLGAGDAYYLAHINGGAEWSFGLDNSDGDKFKIDPSYRLTTSAPFAITTAGHVGIGDDSPLDIFHCSSAGNANSLRIDGTTGYVGIGSADPGEQLEVAGRMVVRKNGSTAIHSDSDLVVIDTGAALSTGQIQLLGGNAGVCQLLLGDTDSYYQGGLVYNHDGDYLAILANAAEKMRIASTGNVLIGTTTDDGHQLAVSNGAGTSAPAIEIEQLDDDEPFIDFVGTSAASAAKSISTWTGGDILGFVRVEINGTDRWMPFYDTPNND